MLAVLLISFSLLFLTITYLKSREPSLFSIYVNSDLTEYFKRKQELAPLLALQKALLLAASSLEKKVIDTNKESHHLQFLYNDRIVSYMYDEIIETKREIEVMRKIIKAEAQELRNGWENKIFEEAQVLAKKKVDDGRVMRVQNDNLFMRKKEVLMNTLYANLTQVK